MLVAEKIFLYPFLSNEPLKSSTCTLLALAWRDAPHANLQYAFAVFACLCSSKCKGLKANSHEEHFCGRRKAIRLKRSLSQTSRSPGREARGDLNGTVINRTDKLYNHGCRWPWSVRRHANYGRHDESLAHTRTRTHAHKGKSCYWVWRKNLSHLLKLVPHHLLLLRNRRGEN